MIKPKTHLHRKRTGPYAWSACGIQFLARGSEARLAEHMSHRVTCQRCRTAVAHEIVKARDAGVCNPPTRTEAWLLARMERKAAARRWKKKVADHRKWKKRYRARQDRN